MRSEDQDVPILLHTLQMLWVEGSLNVYKSVDDPMIVSDHSFSYSFERIKEIV